MSAEARWKTVADQAHAPDIAIVIDLAAKENPRLKGILPIATLRDTLSSRLTSGEKYVSDEEV